MDAAAVDQAVLVELARRDRPAQRGLRRALAEFLAWCGRVGLDPVADEVADVALVVRFVHEVADRSKSTGRSWRWLLLDHFEHTRGELRNAEVGLVSCATPAMAAAHAYTPVDERALVLTAPSVRQAAMRRALCALLVCCLGAGLGRGATAEVAVDDMVFGDDGVWRVAAGGRWLPVRSIVAPVAAVLSGMEPHPSGLLVGVRSHAARVRPDVAGVRIDVRRLRATYIVRLFEAGVPASTILELTGFRSFTALTPYFNQAVRPDSDAFRSLVVQS